MLNRSKKERRHKEEEARMAKEGDCTFQEVFSVVSLAESVKLLPWCFSTGTPLCLMDDALAATEQQSKTALATVDATDLKELTVLGLSSNPTHSPKTPPPAIHLLPDLPFECTLPWGIHSLSPLPASPSKSRATFPAIHLVIVTRREPRLIPQRWRLGVNTALHGAMTTCPT